MPLVSIDNQKRPDVEDLKGTKGYSKIIGVDTYDLLGDELTDQDVECIARIMRIKYWHGKEAFMMSEQSEQSDNKRNIREYNTDEPASWDLIHYGRERIKQVYEKTGRVPTLLVRAVEDMQREYDEMTGFAKCQMASHAVTIKLETFFNKGRFMAEDLIRFLKTQYELFQIANPGEGKAYTVHWAVFAPGSSCLMGDYDVVPDQAEEVDGVELMETITKAEERMAKIVQAAPALADKSKTPAERVNAFKKATGLSNEEAYSTMHELSKLRAPRQTVELNSSAPAGKKEKRASVIINKNAATQLMKTKRALAAIIDPENTRNIKGKIVELDHYKDDDLKFGIYVEDEIKLYNVHYPREEDKTVRAQKGEIAALAVFREGPNRPWHFEKWLR